MSALTSLVTGAGFPRMQVAELKLFLAFLASSKNYPPHHRRCDSQDRLCQSLLSPTQRREKGKEFAKDLFFLTCLSRIGLALFFLADISCNIDVVIDVSAKKPCKECVGSEDRTVFFFLPFPSF